MKNFIKSLILGIVLIISTSLVVKADTNISLKRIHTSADSVEVSIDVYKRQVKKLLILPKINLVN